MAVQQHDWTKVDDALRGAAASWPEKHEGRRTVVFPGAVLLVGQGGEIKYHKAFGCRSLVPELTELKSDMVFDIASLTKVLVTTTLAMQLVQEDLLSLDWRLSRIFQTFGTHGKETMTVRHLLTHMSGYTGTSPYYKSIAKADNAGRSGVMTSRSAVEMVYNEIFRSKLENMPGKVTRYSDIGFILLGNAIEVVSGQHLDKLALKQVIRPLGLESTGYIDLSTMRRRGLEPVLDSIVPTARCPWRGRILCGEVHDDNAWAMGGVAAHAGIFSTATDVHRFARELIECYHGRGSLVEKDTVRKFWTVAGDDPHSTWALGWDTPSKTGSSSGQFFSPGSVGHLGFTGCSLWIDPERELDVVLLTNRIHPSTENNAIREFRPVIHDLVMEALGYAN
ncbi:MAG: serine hydrolase domain-containing protein [Bdellovibrionota bacterium]